ncbi:(2Fe-2S)-binding protein [Streptomyces sp. NPDC057445]|uniref:(2Fe-2S)-binding protein n=1 Tax=Streptomyces sp. NPDC057445 TaxID=3346136 RepID=UPI0036AA7FC5
MELEQLESVGGFFAVRTGEPGTGHVPLARLYAGDLAPLTARVDRVGARLGTPERRVAASVAHLGLTARLWSTALGPAALYGEFPDPAAGDLHWAPDLTTPDDLRWTRAQPLPGTVDTIREAVQYGHLEPLSLALRSDVGVSPRLLWGNAGSALAGASRELNRWARTHGRPDVAGRAAELTAGLLDHPDLAGTVSGPELRRTSCCLYYRTPGGGLCGDCVFDRPPGRRTPQRSSARRGSE